MIQYNDEVLAPYITMNEEERASNFVALLKVDDEDFKAELTRLKTYIITAKQLFDSEPNNVLYERRIDNYSKDFEELLKTYRNSAKPTSVFNIKMGRG